MLRRRQLQSSRSRKDPDERSCLLTPRGDNVLFIIVAEVDCLPLTHLSSLREPCSPRSATDDRSHILRMRKRFLSGMVAGEATLTTTELWTHQAPRRVPAPQLSR